MPKPAWNKKTISTYVTPEQKEVWEKTAIRERKALADFVRDRVESSINNKNLSGKVCVWLEIPNELYDKAENENMELDELIQYYVCRILKHDELVAVGEQSRNGRVKSQDFGT